MDATLDVFTPDEVAELMRTSPQQVRELCNRGDIPAIKFGHFWRIQRKDLQAYLKRNGASGLPDLEETPEAQ